MAETLPIIPGNAEAHNRPDYERAEYTAGKFARALSRAMLAGTRGVRALGEEGLMRWPAEDPEFYKVRAKIAHVTRYYARALQATVGMVAGEAPRLGEGTNAMLVQDAEDIDGRGTKFSVFAQHATLDLLAGGYTAILVDAPPVPEGLMLTLADEQALGLRPYWVPVTSEQIISWSVESPDWSALLIQYKNGTLTADAVSRLARQTVVRRVVIKEAADVAKGDYGTAHVDRYRVLTLDATGVQFAVWEKRKSEGATGEHYALVASGPMLGHKKTPLPEIPLAVGYPGKPVAPFVAEPAQLAIAELNLDHYGITADRRYLIHLTHAPTLFLAGVDGERDDQGNTKDIEVGPNSVVRASNPDAKMAWVSAPDGSLSASKEERDELVRQIATLGLSFLGKDRQSTGTETAKGRSLDLAAENQTHAVIAEGVEDLLEQAWVHHARYRGVEPPEVEMRTAYASPDVNPELARLVYEAMLKGLVDPADWLAYMRTGKLPDTVKLAMTAEELQAAEEAAAAAAAASAAQPDNPEPMAAAA